MRIIINNLIVIILIFIINESALKQLLRLTNRCQKINTSFAVHILVYFLTSLLEICYSFTGVFAYGWMITTQMTLR